MADRKRKTCGDLSGSLNKKGALCGASPLKAGTVVEGVTVKGKHCRGHDPDLPESARFGSRAQAREAAKLGGRPRNPRPSEIMRRLVEEHVETVLAPHFRTLGYDVTRDEQTGELAIVANPEGGAKIYGESKEGDINMTSHDDLGAMILAAEKLLDRIYGRPRQTTEISGPGGGKIDVDVSSDEVRDAREAFLAGFGGTPVGIGGALVKPSEN